MAKLIIRRKGKVWHVFGTQGVNVISYECNKTACDCVGTGFVVDIPEVQINSQFLVEGTDTKTRLVWCDK